MPGEPVYFEIGVDDTERARRFFSEVLGWTYTPGAVDDGWNVQTATLAGGLHGGAPGEGMRVYFDVPDVDAAAAKVRELGGEVGEIHTSEAAGSRYVHCRDDQGTSFALFELGR
ncbi:MAG TPA: VOC family protein [Actinomycetota bacterium]|nr:VOC family protein [Actinomycetota bacterium]